MSTQLRLLVIGNFGSAWGGNRGVCEDLTDRLKERGHRVFYASRRPKPLPRLLDMTGTAWRHRHDYDVAQIDVFSGPAFFWAETVARVLSKANKPFILSLHGGNLPAFSGRQPRRVKKLLQAAFAVTSPSEYLRSQMKPYRDDIRLLPNPLDLSAYPFRLREQVAPRLVWLRAFNAVYNPTLAPRVLSELKDEFPDLHLTMYGGDKGDGSLQKTEKLAAELGVKKHIAFPGGIPKSKVPQKLNEADVFISTTNFDNTPVSVTEAMACGLPVVSTNVGGVPYLIEQEKDGLLVAPDDAQAMAAALRRVLSEADLARQLSQNGRAKAETMSWDILLTRWEDLLAEAVAGVAHKGRMHGG